MLPVLFSCNDFTARDFMAVEQLEHLLDSDGAVGDNVCPRTILRLEPSMCPPSPSNTTKINDDVSLSRNAKIDLGVEFLVGFQRNSFSSKTKPHLEGQYIRLSRWVLF